MNTATHTLKEEVHAIIDDIDDIEILKAVYILVKPYSHEYDIPEEHWIKIENDDADYENGLGENYSWKDVETILKKYKK